jgi:nucleoside-diphosphate-sugar epimerase
MAAVNGTSNFYNDPNYTLSNNVQLDLAVFEFAKKQKSKLIYASSSEVVSDSEKIPTTEESDVFIKNIHNPRWSYRLPKILAENYLSNSDLDYVIVRFFNVYSEDSQSGHFVHDLVKKIREGDFSLIGADETRSFCYVKDAVDALINISILSSKELVNIGHDQEIKISNAANIIANTLGYTDIKWLLLDSRKGSVSRRCPDISKLKTIYKEYKPRSFLQVINEIKDKL